MFQLEESDLNRRCRMLIGDTPLKTWEEHTPGIDSCDIRRVVSASGQDREMDLETG